MLETTLLLITCYSKEKGINLQHFAYDTVVSFVKYTELRMYAKYMNIPVHRIQGCKWSMGNVHKVWENRNV